MIFGLVFVVGDKFLLVGYMVYLGMMSEWLIFRKVRVEVFYDLYGYVIFEVW